MKSSQGVIKEFSVDDKGTVMVGALGLPPITGSNPSARACMTAIKIMKGIEVRSCTQASSLRSFCEDRPRRTENPNMRAIDGSCSIFNMCPGVAKQQIKH